MVLVGRHRRSSGRSGIRTTPSGEAVDSHRNGDGRRRSYGGALDERYRPAGRRGGPQQVGWAPGTSRRLSATWAQDSGFWRSLGRAVVLIRLSVPTPQSNGFAARRSRDRRPRSRGCLARGSPGGTGGKAVEALKMVGEAAVNPLIDALQTATARSAAHAGARWHRKSLSSADPLFAAAPGIKMGQPQLGRPETRCHRAAREIRSCTRTARGACCH